MCAEPVLCPSARCEPGALLLGIVLPGGRVAFAHDRIVVTDEFAAAATEGRPAEQRFRFSSPCAKAACRQWTGQRCGVIDELLEVAGATAPAADLPECSIRSQCRWFGQSGAEACAVCPLVLTDTRSPVEVQFAPHSA